MPTSGLPGIRETQNYCWESSKGPLGWWGNWSIRHLRAWWESWDWSTRRRKAQGDQCIWIPEGRAQRRWSQAPFCCTQWQDQRQRPQAHTQEMLNEHQESLWRWLCIVVGCPRNFWILQPWIYSKDICTLSCAARSRSPYLSRVVDPRSSNLCVPFLRLAFSAVI